MANDFGGNTGLFDSKAFSDAVSKGALEQIKSDAPALQSDSLDASSLLNSALKGGIEITKQVVSAFLPPASTTPAAAPVPAAGGNSGGAAGAGGGGGAAAPAPAPATPGATQQPAAPQDPPANPPPVAIQPPAKEGWTTGQKVGVGVAAASAVIGLGLVFSAKRKESNANR